MVSIKFDVLLKFPSGVAAIAFVFFYTVHKIAGLSVFK